MPIPLHNLCIAAILILMTGCAAPTGHQVASPPIIDEIAGFGLDNCSVNSVTIVSYKNTECYCIASQYDNIFHDNESVITRKLVLANKKLLFDYMKLNDTRLKQLTFSGMRSSKPVLVNGYSVIFSLIPKSSLVQKP